MLPNRAHPPEPRPDPPSNQFSGLFCVWYFTVVYRTMCELLRLASQGLTSIRLRSLRRTFLIAVHASAAFVVELTLASAWASVVARAERDPDARAPTAFDALLMHCLPQALIACVSGLLFVVSTSFISQLGSGDTRPSRHDAVVATFAELFAAS